MPRDKSGHFYYEWYPTIFQADTQHLSLAEDGAYRRLLDHYMLTRTPLPGDDRSLARIIGIGLEEWSSIKNPILTYFKPNGLLLHHKFCDEVLLKHAARMGKARANGKNGGRPSASKPKELTHPVPITKPSGNPITEQNRTEKKEGGVEYGREAHQKVFQRVTTLFPDLLVKSPAAIHSWLAEADVELDILPTIELAAKQGAKPESFAFFTKAIARARRDREAPLPDLGGDPPAAKRGDAVNVDEYYRKLGEKYA